MLFCEVHEDDSFVCLYNPVLQASRDEEFVRFDREHEVGEDRGRDRDIIKLIRARKQAVMMALDPPIPTCWGMSLR